MGHVALAVMAGTTQVPVDESTELVAPILPHSLFRGYSSNDLCFISISRIFFKMIYVSSLFRGYSSKWFMFHLYFENIFQNDLCFIKLHLDFGPISHRSDWNPMLSHVITIQSSEFISNGIHFGGVDWFRNHVVRPLCGGNSTVKAVNT